MYLRCRFLLQRVEVAESGDVSCNSPVVQFASCLVQLMILWHRANDPFFKPGWEGLDWLTSYCGLGVNVKNVRGTPRPIPFGESRYRTVVQQFDPLDGTMDAVTVADSKAREAFILFVSRGYLLPGLLLESFELLVKVSDCFSILVLLLVVDPISLPDGLYELFGEVTEPDWVMDVKPLDDVSSRGGQDGICGGDVGNGHKDGGRSTGRAVRGHGNVGIGGAE